ncbi:50S ribosomal protein L10 [Candidatus Nomurabacteria bacterium]|nr:50S ribosomal protein L10 [Candidatus Nomurabacteria bacterium]
MPISKDKKKEIFDKLKDISGKAKSLVFVNFHGLPVSDITKIRKELVSKGVKYFVAKKTLAKKAFGETKIEGKMPELLGELGLVWSDDLTAPAREIYSFQKKLDGKISILGGVFEGKYMDKAGMTEIAAIPSLQTLHAQFVNLINSPLQGLVMVLDGIAKSKEVK